MKKSTISKFLDGIYNKKNCCLLSKKIVSESNSLQFEERNTTDLLTRVWSYCWHKSLVYYSALLLVGLGITTNTYGQLVGGAAVKANFGIDGDAYANLLQFGNLAGPSNTDDWFNTTYPGAGKGVIKQTDPIPVTANTAFSFRQSITTPTSPFPYPVVGTNQTAPWTGSYLWLDAVYGRDNYVQGGSAEKSYFAGSGDKNSDNPTTWNLGTGGSVPAKDDIIDVYAHIRGEGIRLPDASDPRPFTTLWAYAAASVVVTNGNKHLDFEFFRTELSTPADLNVPGKTGPDGGRTAFTFDTDGSVNVPGTIIISIDYTNGGTKPDVRIRVWMDETVFNNYNNGAANVPFQVDKGTAFEKGTDSGTFGYAAILENVGATNIFGRVNDNDSTLGPPWGTFAGNTPNAVTHYAALQFVEIGINLTAFGLDKRGEQSPCSNILGSLLVKTRSSGGGPNEGAFGSELKDFAGPYLFGNTGTPPVVSVPAKTACAGVGVNLTEGATTDAGPIKYYTGSDYTGEITTPTNYTPTGTMTIYARSESLTNPGCFGLTSFIVTVNAITPGVIAGNQTLCSPFDPAAFTSTTAATGGGIITYQWQMSTTSDVAGFNNISGATLATYDAPVVAVKTWYRRIATSTLNSVACPANSNVLVVTPNPISPGVIAGDQTLCSPFDPAAFSSTTLGSTTGAGVITYQWQSSTTSAVAGFSNIAGATSVTYDAPAVAVKTWFLRIATSTLNSVPCSANSNVLVVTPNAVTAGAIAGNQSICSGGDPIAFTNSTSGTGGGTITYQWQSGTGTCATATFSNIAGATSATFDVPAGLSATTSYRRTAISTLNGVPCSINSNCITVTVINVTPGTIAANQTICSGGDPAAFTVSVPAAGTNLTYQWQSGVGTCATATFTNIIGATSATYDVPAGLTATTSYRRVANSSDAECPATSNCLTVTVNNIVPGSISGDQTLCSPFDPAAFGSVAATGTGVISYQWQSSITSNVAGFTNILGATSAIYDAPVVSAITWFRRVATSTHNGVACSENSNVLKVTPNPIIPGIIDGNQTLCSPFDPIAFTSTTSASTVGAGVISYQWQSSTTSDIAGFSNIIGATSVTYDAPVVAVKTWFRRTATSTLNSIPCIAYSNVLVVTPNNVSSGTISGDQKVCIGDDPAAFTSTIAGTGSGTITYKWQSNTTGCGGAFTDIIGATSVTYDPGVASVTTYYRRVTISTLNGVVCAANSNCLTVTAESCAKALCTYTQGYYGNVGGTSCAPDGGVFGKYTTKELIAKALTSYGGTMTVGLTGKSVWISNNMTDIDALISVMPGGGGSSVLSSGNYGISSLPASYLSKNGRINNTLLAQTIALGLNIGINGALGDFVLQSGMLATAASEGGCGSDIPKDRTCVDGKVINEYERYEIKANLVNALSVKTVQGLYAMANQALGGGDTNGLSLSEIASAVDKINNAFDGCRIFIGYNVPELVCGLSSNITGKTADTEIAGFTASPVPFKDQLTIKYDFDYQSDVKIEVFNAQGNRVLSKADTNSYLNKEVKLNLNVNRGQEQVYVIKLTTNRGSSTKKIMSAR
jgi:hypothetical protein